MGSFELFAIAIVLVLFLAVLGMPIAFSFFLFGFLGMVWLRGFDAAINYLGMAPLQWGSSSDLLALPMFLLMGQFAYSSGISIDLYHAAYRWTSRLPGGLAISTMLACTGFAACTGSSVAAAASMGALAYPEMKKHNYNDGLSTGTIAAGGTLGILIPPSSGFIIYGFLTQTSIGKLFIAGIIPGILVSGLFVLLILLICIFKPQLGPVGQSFPWGERLRSTYRIWGMLVLLIVVLGGLYVGVFAPTEAGAIGAFGAFVIGLSKRALTVRGTYDALINGARLTCFVLTLVIGAMTFSTFLAMSGFQDTFREMVQALPLSPYAILIIILLLYIPLGMVLDAMALGLLTIPVLAPIISDLGFDLIWFAILHTITGEMAAITPPVGINCFVVSDVTKVPLMGVFRGILPFFAIQCIALVILLLFPQISLFLPNLMN